MHILGFQKIVKTVFCVEIKNKYIKDHKIRIPY